MPPAVRTIVFVALVTATAAMPVATRAQSLGNVAIYPGAQPRLERQSEACHRASLSLADVHVAGAAVETYTTHVSADAVLAFYRHELPRFGPVTECRNGTNPGSSVRVDDASLRDALNCHPREFGEGDTELKAGSGSELVIVAVRSIENIREFAVVDVRARTKD